MPPVAQPFGQTILEREKKHLAQHLLGYKSAAITAGYQDDRGNK